MKMQDNKQNNVKQIISALLISLTGYMVLSCGGGSLPDEEEGSSGSGQSGKMYAIETVFKILAHENDVARSTYTGSIVGPAKAQGLGFDENWRKDTVEAGPLPALFLRGTSSHIQRTEVPLGLYLGSDNPINKANKFTGKSADLFRKIKKDEESRFFYDKKNELETAMFPDFAAAKPCINCHNDHPESPKSDWELGDVMGATTWTYPKDSVTYDEAKAMINVYRESAKKMFKDFLTEVNNFEKTKKPEVGEKWPDQGYYIPTAEAFMDSVKIKASDETLQMLLNS